ncbi:MAG: PspC domain-containing protein, partial [Paludibacteraceae bacterium]
MAKQLKKSTNTVIAGVAGGVAEFLGIDPTIVRIVWALTIIFGGFGFFAY